MAGEPNKRDPRLSSLALAALVAGGLVLGIAATGVGSAVVHYTNQTEFCVDCHVYDEFFTHYKTTTHYASDSGVRTGCADCHVPDSNWWALLTTKARSGAAAYWAYYVEGLDTPEEFAEARPRLQDAAHAWFEARDSDTCRSCHVIDEATLAAQSEAARGSHQALLSEGGPTCVSCHADVPHGMADESARGTATEPAEEETEAAETGEPEDAANDAGDAGQRVAAASGPGDAAAGETLAREACATCHKLPDGTGAAAAPALAELMARGPVSEEMLGEVIAQSQHALAKTKVQPADYLDLAAYLNGLR